MPAKLVPTVKTSYNAAQLIAGYVEGWKQQFGEFPKKESIGVLFAQNTLETGSTTSMFCNNLGNVKFIASKNPDDDNDKLYMMLANVWEIQNGVRVTYQPPNPQTWFRAFATLADGVAFELDFLKNHRYQTAWVAVEAGNPANFAHQLKLKNYYTAPESDYVKLMNYYFNKYMKMTAFEDAVAALTPVPEVVLPMPPEPPTLPSNEVSVPEAPPVPKTVATPAKSLLESIMGVLFPFIKLFQKH